MACVEKQCELCTKPIPAYRFGHGTPPKYCSGVCKNTADSHRHREKKNASRRRRYELNAEKEAESKNRWYTENRESILARRKVRYAMLSKTEAGRIYREKKAARSFEARVRAKHGGYFVYFWLDNKRIFYVGKGVCERALAVHKSGRLLALCEQYRRVIGDAFSVEIVDRCLTESEALVIEAHYRRKYNPICNKNECEREATSSRIKLAS